MPHYFLHIRSQTEFFGDKEGANFPDLDSARREAVRVARDFMSDAIRHGEEVDHRMVEIADDAGTVRAIVPFRDVLKMP